MAKIVRRWPRHLAWTHWQDAEQHVEKELKVVAADSLTSRLRFWKDQMQEQGKAATRWLRGANSQPIPEILASDGAATSSAGEGFQQLAAFWSQSGIEKWLFLNLRKFNSKLLLNNAPSFP